MIHGLMILRKNALLHRPLLSFNEFLATDFSLYMNLKFVSDEIRENMLPKIHRMKVARMSK